MLQAKVQYTVYGLDANKRIVQTSWTRDELFVCLLCGQTNDYVPDVKLDHLRLVSGASMKF